MNKGTQKPFSDLYHRYLHENTQTCLLRAMLDNIEERNHPNQAEQDSAEKGESVSKAYEAEGKDAQAAKAHRDS